MSDPNTTATTDGTEPLPKSPKILAVDIVADMRTVAETELEAEIKKRKDSWLVGQVHDVYATVRKEYEAKIRRECPNGVRPLGEVKQGGKKSIGNFAEIAKKVTLANGKTKYVFDQEKLRKRNERCELTTEFENRKTGVVTRCPKHVMAPLPSYPDMQYWLNVEGNIPAPDDRTLSHIPYMEDTIRRHSFGDHLATCYDEGIHGTRSQLGYINDWIFYYVVKEMIKIAPKARLIQIFGSIFHLFPNKGSIRQMQNTYLQLVARFEPSAVEPPASLPEDAKLEDIAAERLANLDKYACQRCMLFCCGCGHAGKEGYSYQVVRKRVPVQTYEACGSDCYRNHLASADKDSTKVGIKEEVIPEISSKTKTMIALLKHTFQEDICRIVAIANKSSEYQFSCTQMHAYVKRLSSCLSSGEDAHQAKFSEQRKKAMEKPDKAKQQRTFNSEFKEKGIHNRMPYTACNHEGVCSTPEQCSCMADGKPCTKYCNCGPTCKITFLGCKCAPGNCKTWRCECYVALFECDPQLCKTCTTNIRKPREEDAPLCTNMNLQIGVSKRLAMAQSEVAGWGCFAPQNFQKGDFICQYTGELISCPEAERRALIYARVKKSYLFGINDMQDVDATRCGNISRFINHSKKANIKCCSEVVSGDHMIGMYALRDIKAGEELFFDYSYNNVHARQFVPKTLQK